MLRLIISAVFSVLATVGLAQTTSGDCSPVVSGSEQVIVNCGGDANRLDESVSSAFIGALDGRYRSTGLNWVDIHAEFNEGTISLSTGNCLAGGDLVQQKSSFIVVFTFSDGICSYLEEFKVGQAIARIIPIPSAMSNNGRINEFFIESGQFVVDQYSGTYEWYENDW